MSTGLECDFIEWEPNKWFYALQDWSCPRGAWDWREYATAYGPFTTYEAARKHLRDNHANPGGHSICAYSDEQAKDEVLAKLIAGATPAEHRRWPSIYRRSW